MEYTKDEKMAMSKVLLDSSDVNLAYSIAAVKLEAYRYNPKFISALSTIAYCYEVKKDYKQALQWYEKYLEVARPGKQGYEFATKSVTFLKGELFMEEP